MSKDIQIFSDKLPAYLKNEQNDESESLIISGSLGYPNKLSIRGRKFTTTINGDIKGSNPTINVIVIDTFPVGRKKLKAYFDKPFSPDEIVTPRCASNDGITPITGDPICDSCLKCEKNQFGSADVGKGKSCSDLKHLFVISPQKLDSDYIFRLSVPPTSFKNMTNFGKKLLANHIPMEAVVVELSFDEEANYPVICFKPVSYLDEDHFKIIQDIKSTFDVSQYYEGSSITSDNIELSSEPEVKRVKTSDIQEATSSEDLVKMWGKKK